MPLATQFERADHTLENLRWGGWHLACFDHAYVAEHPDYQGGTITWNGYLAKWIQDGEYTFTQEHTFTDETDGEVLTIHPGDTFKCWRVVR